MQSRTQDLAVGQEWAYQADRKQPLACVRVTKLGTRKPARTKVYFVDDRFEGREEWVPPARLKVPWDQATLWQDREDKFAAVEAASCSSYETPEYWAATQVLEQLPKELIELNYDRSGGYIVVPDRERLLRFINADASVLADSVAFVDDDGSYVAPWAVTMRPVVDVAPRFSAQLLEQVDLEQARERHRAIYGQYYGNGSRSLFCPPEVCAEANRKRSRCTT